MNAIIFSLKDFFSVGLDSLDSCGPSSRISIGPFSTLVSDRDGGDVWDKSPSGTTGVEEIVINITSLLRPLQLGLISISKEDESRWDPDCHFHGLRVKSLCFSMSRTFSSTDYFKRIGILFLVCSFFFSLPF